MARKHVVISGTGRAGTSFLIQLLTRLGLETGFTDADLDSYLKKPERAGLEKDLREEDCPYVVKSPLFCEYAQEILQRDDIVIEHVFVPMRDLQAAAESRKFVTESAQAEWSPLKRVVKQVTGRQGVPGGLSRASKTEEQELVLLRRIYNLVLALSDTAVPVTLLRHPRIVRDSAYLFEKLKPVLKNTSLDQFNAAFAKAARPDVMHSFNPNDR